MAFALESDLLLGCSIAILMAAIGTALFTKKYIRVLIPGLFLALFLIFLAHRIRVGESGLAIVFGALFNSFRVFLFNEDLSFIMDSTEDARIQMYVSMLYVVAPVLLISAIISVIAAMSTRINLLYARLFCKSFYLFSDLNDKSLLLAEDLYARYGKRLKVVFAGVPELADSDVYDYKSRANSIKAICLKSGIAEQKWVEKVTNKNVHWLLIATDQHRNLQDGIRLNSKYKITHQGSIHVFSEHIEAEMLLDAMEKGQLKVRRISEKRATAQQLFLEHPIYENHLNRKIHVLIFGAGAFGIECVKTAAWCGEIDQFKTKITVVDQNSKPFEQLQLQCPELVETCDISFLRSDVTTPELCDVLKKCETATYIVVALPSDELNAKTCIAIKNHFEKHRFAMQHPLIHVYVENEEKSFLLAHLINGQKQEYGIIPFANMKKTYTEQVLLQSELERLALGMHLSGGYKEVDFEAMEYNRKASVAAALHVKYKLFSAGVSSTEDYAKYIENPDNKKRHVEAEHLRWNAYMRSEGFVSATLDEAKNYLEAFDNHKNIMALKHPCLIDFEALDALTALVKPYKSIDFKAQDVFSIEWIAKGCPVQKQ